MEPSATWGAIHFVLFAMGAVILILVCMQTNFFRIWRRVPKSMEAVRDEFSQLMSERLGVAMRAAELDKEIIDMWDSLPLEYRPVLYQVVRHSQLLEETMLEEAAQKGIYPRAITLPASHVPVERPVEAQDLMPEQSMAMTVVDESTVDNVVPIAQGNASWINGQLVRAR